MRPGKRNPAASVEQRLAWLEHAADVVFEELTAEAKYRAEEVGDLRQRVEALYTDHRAALSDLQRRLNEASIPERLEWWGAGLLLVSLVSGSLDATLHASS